MKNQKRIKELEKEKDYLYMYPQAPMWKIEKIEKEIKLLKEAKE